MEEQGTPTAADMLDQGRRVQDRVLRQGPRDWVVQAGWAAWVLVFIPPFDLLAGNLWGPVVLVASGMGTAVTFRYYRHRLRRVRPLASRPRWFWVVWSAWYLGLIVFAEVFSRHLGFAWTLAAVAAACPLLVWAWYSQRRGHAG